MARRALSLHARQLLAACLGLVAFLGLTGVALDHAFRETTLSNLRERLQSYAYDYVGDFEFDRHGKLIPPQSGSPDSRFDLVGSGLYAQLIGDGQRWDSPSLLGHEVPPSPPFKAGAVNFDGPINFTDSHGQLTRLYRYSQSIVWEVGEVGRSSEIARFTFSVYEDAGQIDRQLQVFRRALWGYLGLSTILLLVVQFLVLRWSLQPVRVLERELSRVQRGVSPQLSMDMPPELEPITASINALIESENTHLDQSRNTLSDLAHSLKTPLAVLRSRLESGADHQALREEVAAQVQRMNEIVSYQLSRAARSGHALFSVPIAILPRAEEIVASLEKVYAQKNVLCEFEVDADASFRGELGDLQELIGNLLENAFKWASRRVLLTVQSEKGVGHRRPGVLISVEDDGPGIPAERVEHVVQRGIRGDERVQGHGIGLAIVQDIVHAYRGELKVDASPDLGGARFVVHFPPVF